LSHRPSFFERAQGNPVPPLTFFSFYHHISVSTSKLLSRLFPLSAGGCSSVSSYFFFLRFAAPFDLRTRFPLHIAVYVADFFRRKDIGGRLEASLFISPCANLLDEFLRRCRARWCGRTGRWFPHGLRRLIFLGSGLCSLLGHLFLSSSFLCLIHSVAYRQVPVVGPRLIFFHGPPLSFGGFFGDCISEAMPNVFLTNMVIRSLRFFVPASTAVAGSPPAAPGADIL